MTSRTSQHTRHTRLHTSRHPRSHPRNGARAAIGGALALALCLAAPPARAETLLVTHLDATGPGTLQAALDAAAASPGPTTIVVTPADGTLTTPTGLGYRGASALTIIGNGLTIASPENVTLLSVTGPATLHLSGLTFEGPGGFSITARGDLGGPAGKGIFLDAAGLAEGAVALTLTDIDVSGVAGHGIHVSDCIRADACGDGTAADDEASPVSIRVTLANLRIEDVGHGHLGADGLRVDERGPGDISLAAMGVTVHGTGGDGIALDEGQDGDVTVEMIGGTFLGNGGYCDPALLADHLPDPPEGAFAPGAMATDAIPGPVAESPDDGCFTRAVSLHDDGSVAAYGFAIASEDGFDVVEAGPGSIFGTFTGGEMSGNGGAGYAVSEGGPGDVDVVFTGFAAHDNAADAIALSEADTGAMYLLATAIEASGNGGAGIRGREAGPGDLSMVLVGIATAGNLGGDLGVGGAQGDAGEGAVHLIDSEIADGAETDGAALHAN